MPISAIEHLTMMPRTAEAADIQGREISQNQQTVNQTAVHFQNQNQQEVRQTAETQKSETEDFDLGESSGGAAGGGARQRKKKEKTKEAPMAPRSNSSFDIMI